MLQARLQKVACEEGPGWLQFKAQTVTGAWRGVQLVQFDLVGQKCATTPPFPGVQARAVTDVLLAGIKEGQATIDPRGVLECAVLLDHGRFLALPVNERAAYGVEQLRQFMASHQEELRAHILHMTHDMPQCPCHYPSPRNRSSCLAGQGARRPSLGGVKPGERCGS